MDNYDNQTEETVETPEVEVEEVEETVDELTAETETEEEEKIDWEARAKKAEAAIIKAKSKPKAKVEEAPKAETKTGMSIFDQKAIFNANIDTQEDLDEVLDYADRKNISVAEALKSTVIKATLAENAEIRNSAKAVNTGTSRRSSGTLTDAQIMANAQKGKMPSSEEDIAKLARMRIGQ